VPGGQSAHLALALCGATELVGQSTHVHAPCVANVPGAHASQVVAPVFLVEEVLREVLDGSQCAHVLKPWAHTVQADEAGVLEKEAGGQDRHELAPSSCE
jgi:hypothetical protein